VNGNFHVGPWLVEPRLNKLSRNGTSIRAEPKQIEVLVCLARHQGETVSKEELIQAVWPDTFVGDDVLVRSIFLLRRLFEDDPQRPDFIQTIPKRGYRLVAPVVWEKEDGTGRDHSDRQTSEPAKTNVFGRTLRYAVGLASAVLLLGLPILLNLGGIRTRLFPPKTSYIRSLAVLPLQNLSGDPAQDYFADGMTEELITQLSGVSALKVISHTSTARYKKTDKSLPDIAHELSVDAIIEGSVTRSADRVRITVQLISGSQDKNLWAKSYERKLEDSLMLQSEVASAIAEEVRARLKPSEENRLTAARPLSLKSLDAYFHGIYHLRRFGTGGGLEEAERAIDQFQHAIALDPDFAIAYVKIAEAYDREGNLLPGNQIAPLEKAAAEKALALDANLAAAHLYLALVRFGYEWDWQGAQQELIRAIELNPNDASAHDGLADYFDAMGHLEEGMNEHQRAQELDPAGDHLSNAFYRARQYDRAVELLTKRLDVEPEDGDTHFALSENYAQKGMYKESIQHLQMAATLYGHKEVAQDIGRTYAVSGYQAAIRRFAQLMEHLQMMPSRIAEFYARASDKERALKWLEASYQIHDPLIQLNSDPCFDLVRSDPRFKELVHRIGLPSTASQ